MPKPLPDSNATTLSLGKLFSDTMTKHVPQHQAITSPQASREKGDWGLKRPFPLKSTLGTTTPAIRIKALDTIENITDFESAAGHTLSLEKFRELRIAMTIPRYTDNYSGVSTLGLKSVFEKTADTTDVKPGTAGSTLRWQYRGPWLSNLTEGELLKYIRDHVRPRRAEFRRKAREAIARDLTAREANIALDRGQPRPPTTQATDITDAQLAEYLRNLRSDTPKLFEFVSEFLDLAPLTKPNLYRSLPGAGGSMDRQDPPSSKESPYGKFGPPPTHPSAGIGYLRTDAYIENHPVYGPQERRTATLARVLSPRQSNRALKIGVNGFVTNPPAGDSAFQTRYNNHYKGRVQSMAGINNLDIETHGGAKAYVEAKTGYVTATGRVMIATLDTSEEAKIIAKEAHGKSKVYHDKQTVRWRPHGDDSQRTNETQPTIESVLDMPQRQADEILKNSEGYGRH